MTRHMVCSNKLVLSNRAISPLLLETIGTELIIKKYVSIFVTLANNPVLFAESNR